MRIHSRAARIAGLATLALIVLSSAAAAQGVLFVKNNRVGIGTSDPSDPLHVVSTTAGSEVMARFTNNGPPFVFYQDTALNVTWALQPTTVGDFTISKLGTGGTELLIKQNGQIRIGPGAATVFNLTPAGNLTINGTLTQGSSRAAKSGFRSVDGREALSRIADLELLEWSYKGERSRHFGPMAEDFHAAFGLGHDGTGLAPGDVAGVALAAIQGLNALVEERDQEIERLSRDIAELRAMVQELATR